MSEAHAAAAGTDRRLVAAAGSAAPVVLAVGWLAYFGVLQWSVVRFRVPIVAVLTGTALLLGWWVLRRRVVDLTRPTVALTLVGSAVITLAVPLFSYVRGGWLTACLTVLATGAVVSAALSLAGRRWATLTALVAVVAHVAVATLAVLGDPAPRIDVWVTLQQASDALARGENFYDMTWQDSPGMQDAFTYLPWTVVLLGPGRWLAGDVRWALALWTVVALAGLWVLATRHTPEAREGGPESARGDAAWRGAAVVALLVFVPGTLTQVDQAWTEPLLLAGLVWWAVLVRSGRPWLAVLPLALACASKQHLAVLLPLLMLWRPFGVRRAVATGVITGALIAPWFLASPADFVNDTVTLLVGFHPIKFANTLYLLALNEYGVTLPFWVTGFAALGTLALAAWLVWRRQPDLAELLRWCALVLLVANLVNKQAFYNQFWLCAALVLASLAVPTPGRGSSARDVGSVGAGAIGPEPAGSRIRADAEVG